jgi:hypothetical protein
MKKVCVTLFCGLLAVATFGSLRVNTAHALPEFKKEFDAKYVKPDGTAEQKSLAAAVKAANCNVCHGKDDKGMDSKKVRNAYGEALHKFIHKKDKKDVEKIRKALADVEAMKNGDGTFGDKLKAGKLPVEPPAK